MEEQELRHLENFQLKKFQCFSKEKLQMIRGVITYQKFL